MIGETYWATGMTLTYRNGQWHADGRPSWSGQVQFFDGGFADDSVSEGRISTEGTLHTRYAVQADEPSAALTAVIDALIRDAERLGIHWQMKHLYYLADGESIEFTPPAGWRELLSSQCRRIGWTNPYEKVPV